MNIEIKLDNKVVSVSRFTKIENILSSCGYENYVDYDKNPIVGVYFNGLVMPLSKSVETSGNMKIIRVFDQDGRRIYRHSLCFLLTYAAKSALPDRNLIIGHSLGDGFFFTFKDDRELSDTELDSLKTKMNELVHAAKRISFSRFGHEEAVNYFESNKMFDTIQMLSCNNDSIINLYKIDNYYDIAYEPLVNNSAILSKWEIRKYRNGLLLRYPTSENIKAISDFRDEPLLFSVFDENKKAGKMLNVSTLGQMNNVIANGNIAQFVRLSEAIHRRKIAFIADRAIEKGARAVFIAGPSSSGKTTFAKRLCEQFQLINYRPIRLSLDDYYKPKNQCPIGPDGQPDLECIDALRLDLFSQNIQDLLDGKKVYLPSFNFGKSQTVFSETPTVLEPNSIIVVEGIHGLNPKVFKAAGKWVSFKVYISALTQLNLDDHNRVSTTDNRIIRRIVRDNRTRNTSARETLEMWASVSRGEKKNIFPFQNKADIMFNSALDYELGVLSPYVQPLLRAIPEDAEIAYPIARRLLTFLENVYSIPSHMVPSDSLLREFVGQSDYE